MGSSHNGSYGFISSSPDDINQGKLGDITFSVDPFTGESFFMYLEHTQNLQKGKLVLYFVCKNKPDKNYVFVPNNHLYKEGKR